MYKQTLTACQYKSNCRISNVVPLPTSDFALLSFQHNPIDSSVGFYIDVFSTSYDRVHESIFVHGGLFSTGMVANLQGDILVYWLSDENAIFASLFDSTFQPIKEAFQVNALDHFPGGATVAINDERQVVVSWIGQGTEFGTSDVVARRLTNDPISGDIDGDFDVDLEDFNILKAHFGATAFPFQGDLNDDGIVNLVDFNIFKGHIGSVAMANPVPPAAANDYDEVSLPQPRNRSHHVHRSSIDFALSVLTQEFHDEVSEVPDDVADNYLRRYRG